LFPGSDAHGFYTLKYEEPVFTGSILARWSARLFFFEGHRSFAVTSAATELIKRRRHFYE
ncbi:MAG: hypothetical protein L0J03_16455, partial [Brevibacterium sp.]|nr:hypothetical protein [Brevibacterium sp.]MDN5911001.1 hypothetical protein [Brevibacterium sp.]MDN6135677.1 hypothetical protein [Brevibacterium sp.]